MGKERIIVLSNGKYFKGKHEPNWSDFDKLFKVTDKGTLLYGEVGDVVRVTREKVEYQIIVNSKNKK
jgi:hypothetical protein